MPHTTNRQAFLAAAQYAPPLASAYCSLVAIELCLKDSHRSWPSIRHDVPQMLADLGDAGLVALASQLRNDLCGLTCTTRTGTPANIRPDAYPELRYAHAATDFPDGAAEAAFEVLQSTVADIIVALGKTGVVP